MKMHCCQYRSMWSQFSTCPWRIGQCTVYWLELASACGGSARNSLGGRWAAGRRGVCASRRAHVAADVKIQVPKHALLPRYFAIIHADAGRHKVARLRVPRKPHLPPLSEGFRRRAGGDGRPRGVAWWAARLCVSRAIIDDYSRTLCRIHLCSRCNRTTRWRAEKIEYAQEVYEVKMTN